MLNLYLNPSFPLLHYFNLLKQQFFHHEDSLSSWSYSTFNQIQYSGFEIVPNGTNLFQSETNSFQCQKKGQ